MAVELREGLLDEELLAKDIIIDSNGIQLLDTNWDDIRVPITTTKKGGAKEPEFKKLLDDGASSQGVNAEHFSAIAEEEVFFAVQIPHSWKFGTSLHAHVHWTPTVNGSSGQKVSWGLEYSVQKIGDVFPDTVIAYGNVTVPDETLVALKHYLTEIVEIDMSNISSVSPMLLCRFFRDATGAGETDDYGSDAAVLEIDFHYEIDTLGSSEEYIK